MRILSLTLVLLGLVSCVYMERCPSREELYPCTCDEELNGDILVTCADPSLTLQRLKYALNCLSYKENVDLTLRGLRLGTVPSNFFYGILITRLDISHCELDTLSDDGRPCLLGLEDTLEELKISSSFTEDNGPAKLQVGHLRKLKELDLSFNAIRELGNDWFERGPASLEYLTISNNDIEKIGNRAFQNLINLKQLSLNGNRFGPIQRSILPNPAQRLQSLELDNNALTDIPEDLFRRMPSLSSISLSSNGITLLDERTWYPVWQQLDFIGLEGNPITCDGRMNWIFRQRKAATVYGRCYAPRQFEGNNLEEFIKSRLP